MGFGDPNSPLWVVDCNPIVDWDRKKILAYKDITHTFANDTFYSAEFGFSNSLYKNLLEQVFPALNYQKRYFHTSIMPYGNKSLSQRIIESELFGFENSDEPGTIFEPVKSSRFIALETFFRSFNWKEKYIVFIGGIKEKTIIPMLNDLLKELYDNYKLPFEHDQYVDDILQDYSKMKFILPEIFGSGQTESALGKRIIARMKLEIV
jgi:hypothetical protein